MKKTVALVIAAIMIAITLVGCGNDNNTAENSTTMSTEDNTDMTNNGTVTDEDGVIGNDDTENTTDFIEDNSSETSAQDNTDNSDNSNVEETSNSLM